MEKSVSDVEKRWRGGRRDSDGRGRKWLYRESRKEKRKTKTKKKKGKIKVRTMGTGNPRAFNPDTRYIFRLKETYSNLIV